MDAPLVTIGLPTYNRPDGLRKALDGITKQTYPNLEIIISDNCSTDPLVNNIIIEFASKDERIVNFRQPENLGLEGNFNFVFSKSNANYFTWMSDDDYFEPNYIEKCVAFLEQHPDYILCSGSAKYYLGEKFVADEKMFRVRQNSPAGRVRKYFGNVQKNGNFYGIFRNKLLSSSPLGLYVGCDWSFMARIAVLGKLNYLDNTYYHRSAEGNSGTKKKMIQRFQLKGWKKYFFELYLASVISKNVFIDPQVNKTLSGFTRSWIITRSFFQISMKLVMNFIKKKLGIRSY